MMLTVPSNWAAFPNSFRHVQATLAPLCTWFAPFTRTPYVRTISSFLVFALHSIPYLSGAHNICSPLSWSLFLLSRFTGTPVHANASPPESSKPRRCQPGTSGERLDQGCLFPPWHRNVDVYSVFVLYQDRGEQGPADAGDRTGLALTRKYKVTRTEYSVLLTRILPVTIRPDWAPGPTPFTAVLGVLRTTCGRPSSALNAARCP